MARVGGIKVKVSHKTRRAFLDFDKRLRELQADLKATGLTYEEATESLQEFAYRLTEKDQTVMPMRGWVWEDQKELL